MMRRRGGATGAPSDGDGDGDGDDVDDDVDDDDFDGGAAFVTGAPGQTHADDGDGDDNDDDNDDGDDDANEVASFPALIKNRPGARTDRPQVSGAARAPAELGHRRRP